MKSKQILVFEERKKPEYPEKNLSVQGREPWELNLAALVEGKCSHQRAIPAPTIFEVYVKFLIYLGFNKL